MEYVPYREYLRGVFLFGNFRKETIMDGTERKENNEKETACLQKNSEYCK